MVKVLRPPEEVIRLDDTVDGEIPVTRNGGGRGRSDKGGRGKGRGKGENGKGPTVKPHKGLRPLMQKYERPAEGELKVKGDHKLAAQVRNRKQQDEEAVFMLAKSEVLQTEQSGFIEAENKDDRTWRITQDEIEASAGVGVAQKRFSFSLPYGPYKSAFARNGQYMLAGGRKGHVTLLHCDTMKILAELQLKETVRAVQPLHNHLMFAVAQKKYMFIYDHQGKEIHCVKRMREPTHLEFLPYHYLLASASDGAELCYRDISTGNEVAVLKTHLGPARSMRQNPQNAILHLGHSQGLVSLWTPTIKEPVVKVFCHTGHVTGIACHGNYMVTSGADSYWKVWDLRKYETLHSFRTFGHAAVDIDVSMTGLVALGFGSHFQVWKDAFSSARPQRPYMTDEFPGKALESVRFRPFEDVCGVGHSDGFCALLIPGAGLANVDSLEANPFETKKDRKSKEVKSLLEKLPPESIMLDPTRIGSINAAVVKKLTEEARKKEEEEAAAKKKPVKKMRGKNKVGKRLKRKHLQEGVAQRDKAKGRVDGQDGSSDDEDSDEEEPADTKAGKSSGDANSGSKPVPPGTGAALSRFYNKRRRKT